MRAPATYPDEPEPGDHLREDFLDFPTAWRIQNAGVDHTDRRCSAVQTGGALLCDCGGVEVAWMARVAAQRAARGEVLR